jgi:hypothetical protein
MNKTTIFFSLTLAAVLFYIYENRAPGYLRLSADEKESYAVILRDKASPPEKYLADTVRTHSVVMLGEPHRISEHYGFLAGAGSFTGIRTSSRSRGGAGPGPACVRLRGRV